MLPRVGIPSLRRGVQRIRNYEPFNIPVAIIDGDLAEAALCDTLNSVNMAQGLCTRRWRRGRAASP